MGQDEQGRKILMEYRIISGAAEERRQVYMSPRSAGRVKRAGRRTKTAPAQVKRNEKEARLQLARKFNCNLRAGDLLINMMYPRGKEPPYDRAVLDVDAVIAALRARYKAMTGQNLKWVVVTSQKNPRTGGPAPIHHHLVIQAMPWDFVSTLWDLSHLDYKPLDASGDYTALANYLVDNAPEEEGKRKWRCSRGWAQPIYTEPKPCAAVGSFRLPKGARVKERRVSDGEEAAIRAAYIRFVRPEKTIRGDKAAVRTGAGGDHDSGRGRGDKDTRGRGKGGA